MTSGPSAINLSCSYRPRRVQSAPVCGCSFVGVLVRTPSSRDCCRLVISFVSYAVRARVRLQLRRSARSHPFVEDYRDIVRVVCSPRPCAAAASSECSFVLLRRATFSYARLARFV